MRTAMHRTCALAVTALVALGCGDDDGPTDEMPPDMATDQGAPDPDDLGMDPDIGPSDMGIEFGDLSDLRVRDAELEVPFEASGGGTLDTIVGWLTDTIQIQPFSEADSAVITVDGEEVASGAYSDPVTLTGATTEIEITIDHLGNGYTYTLVVHRNERSTYFKPLDPSVGDSFGEGIALEGDTLIVGAPADASAAIGIDGDPEDDSAFWRGAAFVFRRSFDGSWTEEAYLKPDTAGERMRFGYAIDMEGDVAVISALDANRVYVFRRTDGVWAQEDVLAHASPDTEDKFGESVAISGDTIAVGVRLDDSASAGIGGDPANNGLENSGAVFVFRRSGAGWEREAFIKASNAGMGDLFGSSVALDGNRLLVGAPGERSNAVDVGGDQTDDSLELAGAAYVFERTGTAWSQVAYLKASNPDARDEFGRTVAASGDFLVVGAPHESSSATGFDGDGSSNDAYRSGAAYIFRRTGTAVVPMAYVKSSNPAMNHDFGRGIAIEGSFMVIGARGDRSTATGLDGDQSIDSLDAAGAGYAFRFDGASWEQTHFIKPPNTQMQMLFGAPVDIAGTWVAFGAIWENGGGSGVASPTELQGSASRSGAAYVF